MNYILNEIQSNYVLFTKKYYIETCFFKELVIGRSTVSLQFIVKRFIEKNYNLVRYN